MLQFDDLAASFEALGVPGPVIAHASLASFGEVDGGAATVARALVAVFKGVMMPTFTYKTMIVPGTGPAGNGLAYGAFTDQNKMAEFWSPGMPADKMMGIIPETLRQLPGACRSAHPVLSFAGVGVDHLLGLQTLAAPLAPIKGLADAGGSVILLGVNHSANTGIHLAEKLAGRKTFTRWALTPGGAVSVPDFPGCSNGFEGLAAHFEGILHRGWAGSSLAQAFPLREMLEIAKAEFCQKPQGWLCSQLDCGRCNAVRGTL